jgi:hypothetical protein
LGDPLGRDGEYGSFLLIQPNFVFRYERPNLVIVTLFDTVSVFPSNLCTANSCHIEGWSHRRGSVPDIDIFGLAGILSGRSHAG